MRSATNPLSSERPAGVWLSRAEVRQIDAAAESLLGMPGLLLMENAARGVCDCLLQEQLAGRVLIICGPGNNGGDGLALMRQLGAVGQTAAVRILNAGKTLTPDAAANLGFLRHSGIETSECDGNSLADELRHLSAADWIVDALLGTGMLGPPRSPFSEVIAAANQSPARILAVDIPSGLDCDTGLPLGECIRATRTATFVAPKLGFRNPAAREFTGPVDVCHIGLPQCWLQSFRRAT